MMPTIASPVSSAPSSRSLACQSWNERIWSDGGPIDPSPTIDQAINGGYGKVQLIYQSHVVLGLDVSQNLSKEHATWRWNNVFAFIPGTWMKELIEMAAHIEASQAQYFEDFADKDALERARQIKL
jgi:hypothetical protein